MRKNLWLIQKFCLYFTFLKDETELDVTKHEIILTVESNDVAKASLYTSLDKGKSREIWLEKRIEEDTGVESILNIGR
jgi:hypothetical protein